MQDDTREPSKLPGPSLLDLRDSWRPSVFHGFVALYENAFTEPSEREAPSDWKQRLLNADSTEAFKQHLVVLGRELDTDTPEIWGGLAFEYYDEPACGLLTYLVVAPHRRRVGCANRLVSAALDTLKEHAAAADRRLRAVFGEVRDPRRSTACAAEQASDFERTEALRRLGAQWLRLPYVQPALCDDQSRADHLLLTAFHQAWPPDAQPQADAVSDFLHAFYKALGVSEPDEDSDYVAARDTLQRDGLVITELPGVEWPALHFSSAAIALHFVERSSRRKNSVTTAVPKATPCPFYSSFESDLLAYQFQERGLLASQCVTHRLLPVVVHYPSEFVFHSEGRTVPVVSPRRSVNAQVGLSRTDFPLSAMTIWHLTFRPTSQEAFSEYDLIKLTHLHGGVQERTSLKEDIRFELNGTMHTAGELLAKLSGEDLQHSVPLAGTVQVDTADSKSDNVPWRRLFEVVRRAREGQEDDIELIAGWLSDDDDLGRALRACVGVVGEIFDFGRLDVDEVLDTLDSTVPFGSGIMRVHRGTLTLLDGSDGALGACAETIGISPYLVIPHALMLHNEAVVRHVEDIMETGSGTTDLDSLESMLARADRALGRNLLPNVFHYRTEQALFSRGLVGRGSQARMEAVHRKVEGLRARVESARQGRRQRAESLIALILGLVSLLAAKDLVFDLMEYVGVGVDARWAVFLGGLVTLSVLLLFLTLRRLWPSRSSGD